MKSDIKPIFASIILATIPFTLKMLNTAAIAQLDTMEAFAIATIEITALLIFSSPISAFLISFIQKKCFPSFLLSSLKLLAILIFTTIISIYFNIATQTFSIIALSATSIILYTKQASEKPQSLIAIKTIERLFFLFCPIASAIAKIKFDVEISTMICIILMTRLLVVLLSTKNYFTRLHHTKLSKSVLNINAMSSVAITYISAQTLYIFRSTINENYGEEISGLLFLALQVAGMLMSGASVFVNYATPLMFNFNNRLNVNVIKLTSIYLLLCICGISLVLADPLGIINFFLNQKLDVIMEEFSNELLLGFAIYSASGVMTITQMRFQALGKNIILMLIYSISFFTFLVALTFDPFFSYFLFISIPAILSLVIAYFKFGQSENV